MENKFTTGTWFIDKGNSPDEFIIRTRINDENFDICSFSCDETDNIEANAALLVTAPALYKVCTDLLNAFIHVENDIKGNQARTNIFKYCPEFGRIATAARIAIEKTNP